MLKTILVALLTFSMLISNGMAVLAVGTGERVAKSNHLIIEKMIVSEGSIALDVEMSGLSKGRGTNSLLFSAERESPFTVIIANNELRGPLPGSMKILSQSPLALPARMNLSEGNIAVEVMPFGNHYELAVLDQKTGYVFFNIEGHQYDYNADTRVFSIREGRLLLSQEYAAELGRSGDAGKVVGQFAASTTLRTIDTLIDGKSENEPLFQSNGLTPMSEAFASLFNAPKLCTSNAGTVPGPDVVVGDVVGLAQFGGASGTQVGLAVGTDSCNYGTIDLNWFANPSNDHPTIPQNLYRMSGGTTNDERFEQIGQSQVKHGFTALTQNLCGLGCNGVGGTRLGSGCSDPYSASLNSGPNLGSKAWINPFTGAFPRNDSATPNNSHTSHAHAGPTHRILTESSNLNTSTNAGATYYAEAQYVTPHEYTWCQTNPTQCNMYNNVSYRRYNVSGTASPFTFAPVGATQRAKSAITAWSGSVQTEIRPAPGQDGIGVVAYKVTNPSAGVWHYEYAVYNQSLDRAIQSFSVPVGNGVTLTNVGFNAPPQHPGSPADGTAGSTGFSNAAWSQSQANSAMTWSSETLAQNPNANAIRWATMYNFRFDSNRPPQNVDATVGFFKTGAPITVAVQGPSAAPATNFSVSGRITTDRGQGVSRAFVSITDSNGNVRTVVTGSLGLYRFDNVAGGGTYTISVQSRRYAFEPRTVDVNSNITEFDFLAGPI